MAINTRNPSAPSGDEIAEGEGVSGYGDDYSPEGVFQYVRRCYKEARDGTSKWRTNVKKYYAFKSGDQWDPADSTRLKENGRPCITYNRIEPIINAVSGVEIQNRQSIRFIPRSMEDGPVNEIITSASDFLRDEAGSNESESDAFEDNLICGLGWTETRMAYDEDPDGKMVDLRIDPREIYHDPTAQQRNMTDGRYVLRVKDFDCDDAKRMFPHIADEDDLHADWAADVEDTKSNSVIRQSRAKYENGNGGKRPKRGKVRIVECQWVAYEKVYAFVNPTTQEVERVDQYTFEKLKKKLSRSAKQELESTEQRIKVYKRAFCGSKLLNPIDPQTKKPDLTPPCDVDFTYQCITGKRDQNEREWYGLVKPMMDPQRWANGFMSAILHIIQTSGKGMMMEETAVSDVREFEQKFAKPDAIKWLAPNAVKEGKIFPIPNQSLPSGLPDMMVHAISAIRDVTGVNLELLGLADRQQAGVLEQQRKQAGLTILAGLYDSLRQYRKRKGRIILWYIQNRLSDGRLIRIVGPEGSQYVPLAQDQVAGRYDVIVDDTPTSPNAKERIWDTVMSMGPALTQAGMPPQIWASLLRYSPLPSSVSEPMAKQLMEPQGPPPEVQIQQQKFDLEKQKMEMEAQLKQQQAQFDMEVEKARLALEIEKAKVQMQIEGEKAHQQMQIKQQEAAIDAQVAQQRAETDMALANQKSQNDLAIAGAKADADINIADRKAQNDMNVQTAKGEAEFEAKTGGSFSKTIEAILADNQKRDERQDQQIQLLAKLIGAETEIIRDQSGRAVGSRKRMN